MLVIADVVGLYPSIPHCAGLSSLKEDFENRVNKQVPTRGLVKMVKFILSNNYVEFSETVFQQISGTAIGANFGGETEYLQTQRLKPLVSLSFIDHMLFVWTHGKENLKNLMKDFNNFRSNLKFTFECDGSFINSLDLNVKVNNGELTTSVYIKPTDRQ